MLCFPCVTFGTLRAYILDCDFIAVPGQWAREIYQGNIPGKYNGAMCGCEVEIVEVVNKKRVELL